MAVSEDFKKILPTGLYVFVPAFIEQLFSNCFKSGFRVAHLLGSLNVPAMIATVSHPDIADVRNCALSVWYEKIPDYSHMLFIDADIGFPPKLLLDMLAFNQPIVGAVYPKKQDERDWVLGVSPTDDKQRLISKCGGFVSCDGLGGGCLLIRRDAITEMVEKYPEMITTDIDSAPMHNALQAAGMTRLFKFFDKITLPNGKVISEDISFCKRWMDLNLSSPLDDMKAQDFDSRMDKNGHHVWAAIGHQLEHMGPNTWRGCFRDEVICTRNEPVGKAIAA